MKTKLDLQTFTIVAPRSELARRTLLRGLGSALIAAPPWPILSCDDGAVANDNGGDAGAGGTNGAGGAAATGSAYTFQTQQLPDGALLAWKTLVVRSSLSEASCSVPAGSGGGIMGGPGAGGAPGPGGPPPG